MICAFVAKATAAIGVQDQAPIIAPHFAGNCDARQKSDNFYKRGLAMDHIKSIAAAAALLCVAALADTMSVRAEDNLPLITLKPMSGPGAASADHRFLLNEIVGKKQAIGYFLNESGRCQVTIMVGDAFNGGDVVDPAPVRFQVALGIGAKARMDTAEGGSLEFICQERAQVMTVKAGSLPQTYPSGT